MPSTSHYKIFDYWKDKCIDEQGNVYIEREEVFRFTQTVVYDWGEPNCWACGRIIPVENEPKYQEWIEAEDLKSIWNCRTLRRCTERAHIIPRSLGGKDEPENLFLLCPKCHKESPDTSMPSMFLAWVYQRRRRKHPALEVWEEASKILREKYGIYVPYVKWDVAKKNTTYHPGSDMHQTMVYAIVADAIRNKSTLNEANEMLFIEMINQKIRELDVHNGDPAVIDAYKACLTMYETIKNTESAALSINQTPA